MIKYPIILLFAGVIVFTATAQVKQIRKLDGSSISATAIDKIIVQLMENAEVTGLNLAIINDNRVAYVRSYGFKNKKKGERIDTSTIFYAASFSKAVFAYLVMQLVQEGKLDLDKPIHEYLDKPIPDYDNYKDLAGDDRWKLITARHCLSHTTGFPNWRNFNPNRNRKLEFFFSPGTRYAYSGEGLALLQVVIEKIAGKPLEEMMQEKVFRPLGMTRTSYVWQPAFENNYAIGYDGDGVPLQKRKSTRAGAAGSMETSIGDYSRFIAAVMQGKGLAKKAKEEMIARQISINSAHQFPSLRTDTTDENRKIQLSYGLGWGLLTSPYGKAFFKEGHDDGWEHYNINFSDKGISIILMTNSSNGESIFKEALEKIIGDTFTPSNWEFYTPYRRAIKLEAGALEEFTGLFRMEKEDIEASITITNGILKLDSEKAGLSRVVLYPEKKDNFFMKAADITLEFIRNDTGKIDKLIAWDSGVRNEFKKIK